MACVFALVMVFTLLPSHPSNAQDPPLGEVVPCEPEMECPRGFVCELCTPGGLWVSATYVTEIDGVAQEERNVRWLNDNGEAWRATLDTGPDGMIDWVSRLLCDSASPPRCFYLAWHHIDDNRDGVPDRRVQRVPTDEGENLVLDTDANGLPDEVCALYGETLSDARCVPSAYPRDVVEVECPPYSGTDDVVERTCFESGNTTIVSRLYRAQTISMTTTDENGGIVLETHDYDGDGVLEVRSQYDLDEEGNRVEWLQETTSDNHWFAPIRHCTYDPPCEAPFYSCPGMICPDVSTADVAPRVEPTPSPEDDGGLVWQDGGECPETTYRSRSGVCTCNAQGDIVTWDNVEPDGIADWRARYDYDLVGRRLFQEIDRDVDGIVDSRERFAHSDHSTVSELDWDADGTIDDRNYLAYDANGDLILEEWDHDANGTVNRRCTYDPPCPAPFRDCTDSCQFPLHTRPDPSAEPPASLVWEDGGPCPEWVVCDGVCTCNTYGDKVTLDYDEDGSIDLRRRYFYDDNRNVQVAEYDLDADGVVDRRILYTYDDGGARLTQEVQDLFFDRSRSCNYSPPCPFPFGDCADTCQPATEAPVTPSQ